MSIQLIMSPHPHMKCNFSYDSFIKFGYNIFDSCPVCEKNGVTCGFQCHSQIREIVQNKVQLFRRKYGRMYKFSKEMNYVLGRKCVSCGSRSEELKKHRKYFYCDSECISNFQSKLKNKLNRSNKSDKLSTCMQSLKL
jgi:hypothetical protein